MPPLLPGEEGVFLSFRKEPKGIRSFLFEKKAAIKREEIQTGLGYPEREQARPKVNQKFPSFLLPCERR